MLSACIPVRGYRGGAEMSRRIYSPLSLIAVSWLDESTLPSFQALRTNPPLGCYDAHLACRCTLSSNIEETKYA